MNKPQIQLPSVQSLFIQMRIGNQKLSSGTAFIVKGAGGPLLITNRHNFTGRNNITNEMLGSHIPDNVLIYHNKSNFLGGWVITEENLEEDYTPLWFEHPTLKQRADFVALRLTNFKDVRIYPYEIEFNALQIDVQPADSLSVVGFPFGLSSAGSLAIWCTGFMASDPDINYNGLPVFLIDCRTREGQSGSAVIVHKNAGVAKLKSNETVIFQQSVTNLLGIYSGRINDKSDIGMVWKTSAIKELVDSIK